MRKDIYFSSRGKGMIHACRWEPEGEVKGVVQLVHGIAEHVQRYDDFAKYLNALGYLVVAEDHMGHGLSGDKDCARGYFYGGWFAAVEDTWQLLEQTKDEFPKLPYILFGHSMGSFMTRTLLITHPDSGISGAVICGTGWMSSVVLSAGKGICSAVCHSGDETAPSEKLQGLVFGSYNNRIEHPKTAYDWLNRDGKEVQKYIDDPMCGFTVSAGLLRDMLGGMQFIQKAENLKKMNRSFPVHFVAGGADPVGNFGSGVRAAADKFSAAGMEKVTCRIYPLCRHEILNEINKTEIYEDIGQWIESL